MSGTTDQATSRPYRLYLSEQQIPTAWYNLRADMPEKPEPMRLPNGAVATHADLAPVFADALIDQELDDETPYVEIPEPVREMYKVYRPSPLCRAYNLERALKAETADAEYKKGVELTMTQLVESLKGIGVEKIMADPGTEFDPNLHNAVMHIENEELGENVIAEVFQQGFQIGGKVIRHAMVQVAN